jgi:hypothetical protein
VLKVVFKQFCSGERVVMVMVVIMVTVLGKLLCARKTRAKPVGAVYDNTKLVG